MTQQQILPGQIVGGIPEGGSNLHASSSWNVAEDGQDILELAALPFEESLQIHKNGLLQREGSGFSYTRAGQTVTFEVPLEEGDLISDHYLTETESPGNSVLTALPVAEIIPGSLMNLNYNYQHTFTLPSGVVDDDLMIAAWNNWHGWGVNEAAGWIPDYYPNGGTVVCHKFIDTEIAGSVISPSLSGQGYRAAGQVVLVRGADLSAPIHAITTAGASISVGSVGRRVIHMVEQGGGGANPTLSRGTEIQAAYDGTLGVRASQEEVAAGGSVACSTNTGFLASVAIKAA